MKLYIIGAGKYGREIEDVAEQTGKYDTIAYFDDKAADALGKCADFVGCIAPDAAFYVAFGDNVLRKKWLDELKAQGGQLATIVHPTAYISPKAKIGQGVAILPQTIVNSYTEIKDGCIINSGAIVDHDCVVEDCVHVCVGAIVKADNHLPAEMKIEAGVVIERNTYQ